MKKFEDPIEKLFAQSQGKGVWQQLRELDPALKFMAVFTILVIVSETYMYFSGK